MTSRVAFFVSILVIIFGMLFCAINSAGITFCSTTGCSIYKNYTFLGKSFYFWGVVGFGIALVLLCLTKWLNIYYYFLYITVCIIIEISLLIYQFFYLQCISCLIIGLIWAVLYYLTLKQVNLPTIKYDKYINLFVICIGLIIFDFLLFFKSQIQPWPIYGNNNATIKVFFSPTCSHCKKTIKQLIDYNIINANNIAIYPIAKNEDDLNKICLLQCELKKDKTIEDALNICFEKKCPDYLKINFWEKMNLRINLFKNKVVLNKMGITTVPVILTNQILIPFQNLELGNKQTLKFLFDQVPSQDIGCSLTELSNCQ